MITSYAGNDAQVLEYLQRNGNKVEVPDDVITQQRGGAYIEKKVRSQIAREQADVEREAADAEVLNARISSIESSEAEPEEPEEVEPQQPMVTPEQAAILANAATNGAAAIASHSFRSEEAQLRLEQVNNRIKEEAESTLTNLQTEQEVVLTEVRDATTAATNSVVDLEAFKQSVRDELWAEIAKDDYKGAKGDKGATGGFGAGFAYCDSDPTRTDIVSAGKKWFGRRVIAGDTLLQPVEGGLQFWRSANAQSWQKVDFRTNQQVLVSKKLQIQDASTKVNAPISITKVTPGGGGSTPLSTKTLSGAVNGAAIRIADGAAYGAELEREGVYCTAAKIIWQVTAADGPNAGDSAYATSDLLLDPTTGATDWTESAELGSLGVSLDLTFSNGSGAVPGWARAGSTASATHTPIIEATVTGNSSGATNFLINGAVIWAMPTQSSGQPLAAAW